MSGVLFQHIGVSGAYSIAIAIVVVTLLITIATTPEGDCKHVSEPIGK